MKIEQILYINLDTRRDRDEAFCKVMESINGSLPMLRRFRAHDGRDYENRETMIDAAISDGFDFVREHRYAGQTQRGTIGYTWSYASCLRMCVEFEKTTLILFDDRPLGKPISEVNDVLQRIAMQRLNLFRILQLTWYNWLDKEQRISNKREMPFLDNYCYGFSGAGDQHSIYSPEGARWMLNAMALCPTGPESLTGFYSTIPLDKLPGIFSCKHAQVWAGSIPLRDDAQDRIEIDEA